MSLDALIMLSGAFVAVLPFLGFPNSWDNALFFLAGIFIVSLGIIVRRRGGRTPQPMPPKNENAFVENDPHVPRHEKT
ncbi:MAG TPA: hypothetical protein VJ043_00845 [Candidatus Paceibacterota bacterium]|nr:hypothetical protein [Candidatus Paceibacterota bacterium]